jgi:ATP-dependent helicase IRC3
MTIATVKQSTANKSYELRDYQAQAIKAIDDAIASGLRRVVVSLPTGTGKTVIFAHWLRSRPCPSLVLVHRDELVVQAVEKLRDVNPDRRVGIVKAELDEWNADLVVASVQSLQRKRLERYQPGHFAQIVIDECHHATAPSYQRILDHLKAPVVIGVSATPFRGDRQSLSSVFERLVFSLSFPNAVKDGWLVDFVPYRVKSGISLEDVHTTAGDFALGELERAVNVDARNDLIVQSWLKLGENRRTIAFTVGVEHAYQLASLFRSAGVPAEALCGETPINERKGILKRLKSGETRVVTNAMVLTEGFDCPEVSCIVIGRPTKSVGLFTQMVGRGSRVSHGKNDCIVIDVADESGRHRVVSVAELIGYHNVKNGESLVKSSLRRKELLDTEIGAILEQLRDVGDLKVERLESMVEDFTDAMSLDTPYPDWREIYDEVIEDEDAVGQWQPSDGKEIDWSTPATERQVARLCDFGWPKDRAAALTKGQASVALDKVSEAINAWANRRVKSWMLVLDIDEYDAKKIFGELWRMAPASEKQLDFLNRLGLNVSGLVLSKGEASFLIDMLLK